MATQIGNLSGFSSTSVDKAHNSTLTATLGIPSINNFGVLSVTLWLSAIRTYVSDCYLIITKGSATLSTENLTNNSATHSELVDCFTFNEFWLSGASGTVTITVKRQGGGAGNAINFRDGVYGELTIEYENGAKVFIKIGGTWKEKSGFYTKVSGAWKTVKRTWTKVSGVWK